jgi:hypothetical protein
VLAAGCASSNTASLNSASRYVVTEADLVNVREESAYEALQQLRPTFLRSRDPQSGEWRVASGEWRVASDNEEGPR